MAKALMVQGTMSSAGKSYIVTGLCRYYTKKGYRVAPFKSQNMALNSFVTTDGLEMGRAQVVQAYACNKEPSVFMNPILLKPTTDIGSQIIVEGKPIGNMKAAEYFAFKKNLIPNIIHAYDLLAEENDIIIVEGAGSPAEINLKENDIVNMGLAKLLDIPVVLVGDIDPGGVFAQLLGTIDLLDENERSRIKGLIINKFRGDVNLLKPGIRMLEDKCNKPVLGVVKMTSADIEEEDSITSAFHKTNDMDAYIDIAVIKLPRISNFTDFDPLERIDGIGVRYVTKPIEIQSPDLIIIPGTKSTISDLHWLKETGLFDAIRGYSKDVPILGICGGMQMLGDIVDDSDKVEGESTIETGLGLLPIETKLCDEKQTRQCEGRFEKIEGFFSSFSGVNYLGYEIHNGITKETNGLQTNQNGDCVCNFSNGEKVFGTYIHGIFDNASVVDALIAALMQAKGIAGKNRNKDFYAINSNDYRNEQYDIIAKSLEEALDFQLIDKILGL